MWLDVDNHRSQNRRCRVVKRQIVESSQTCELYFTKLRVQRHPPAKQDCVDPEERIKMSIEDARKRRGAPLDTPSGLGSNATKDISAALTVLLADVFALYVKNQELPLAHIRPAFPGLSPAP